MRKDQLQFTGVRSLLKITLNVLREANVMLKQYLGVEPDLARSLRKSWRWMGKEEDVGRNPISAGVARLARNVRDLIKGELVFG